MREQLNFFRANGYSVVPEALSADELAVLNAAIDRDREQYPQLWQHRGEGGRYQSAALLLSSRAFDAVIRHSAVFGLVEELMGGELCFEELSAMVRQPHVQDPPQAVWHRDTGHWPDHPLALRNLSLVYYLTAVDAASHCLRRRAGNCGAKALRARCAGPTARSGTLRQSGDGDCIQCG